MCCTESAHYRCTKADLLAISDVTSVLSNWEPETGSIFKRVLPLLMELLETEFVGAYLPVRTVNGWACAFSEGLWRLRPIEEVGDYLRDRLSRHIASAPAYLRLETVPGPEQNRVLSFRSLVSEEDWANHVASVASVLGFTKDCYDLRVLCAHRGELLGWCGAYQRHPFTARQHAVFQRIVPTLRRQALWERRLGFAAIHEQAFLQALQAMPQPAYLVDPAARVVAVNGLGQQRLDGGQNTTHNQICEWLREATSVSADSTTWELPNATLTSLSARGVPKHYLLIEHTSSPGVTQALTSAAKRWSLTKRQTDVLRWLVDGECNKGIAAKLGCSVRAVEYHISQMLKKSETHTRAGLMAGVFAE